MTAFYFEIPPTADDLCLVRRRSTLAMWYVLLDELKDADRAIPADYPFDQRAESTQRDMLLIRDLNAPYLGSE